MSGSAIEPVFLGLTAGELWTVLVAIVCNVACAILGCYLVLRRLSLMGDAISHAVLPGIAVAAMLSGGQYTSVGIFVGAMAVGVLTTFLTQTLQSFGKVPEDSSLGIVFVSLFAVGVILMSKSRTIANVDLDPGCVLYGLLEYVSLGKEEWFGVEIPQALPTMLLALAITLIVVLVLWKELKITAFDPALATAMGINAVFVHYVLMAMVAGVTVAAFEAVGSILVIVMLIVPAATAYLLADRLTAMMAWATGLAIATSVVGTVLSPSNANLAGMMAVVAGGFFFLAVFLAPKHGVLAKVWRNTQLGLRIVSEDILASLYRQEEAGAMATDAVSVHGFLRRLAVVALKRQGHVQQVDGGLLILTDEGRERARSIVRAHRLWEAYLDKYFVLPPDHLHEPAMRMEHFLDPAMQKQLAAELDQPGIDPHGRAIPPGKIDERL